MLQAAETGCLPGDDLSENISGDFSRLSIDSEGANEPQDHSVFRIRRLGFLGL
jgi:hypothetical protein